MDDASQHELDSIDTQSQGDSRVWTWQDRKSDSFNFEDCVLLLHYRKISSMLCMMLRNVIICGICTLLKVLGHHYVAIK